MVCTSTFLYNAKRQRSLQHFIQIQPLPEQFKVVDLPSGDNTVKDFEHKKIIRVLRGGMKPDSIVTFKTFSGHYAACGFQVSLQRKQMQYQIQVITHNLYSFLSSFKCQVYLPSFMFVVTSWVSFLIKPEVVPGRMALLVTLFLVLINIFNSVR